MSCLFFSYLLRLLWWAPRGHRTSSVPPLYGLSWSFAKACCSPDTVISWKVKSALWGGGATFEHTAHALTMTFYHDRYRLQWTQQNSAQKYTLFILAGFITWIGTVHLFLDPCSVKVPVCKRGGCILTIDLNFVPWEVQGLTVDNAGVKEVASRLARHKTSCCL